MSDISNYSFSYSYSLQASEEPPSASPDLYAFGGCEEYHLPGERVLLYNPSNEKQTIVDHEVLYALRFCNRFRTIDAQVEEVCRHIPALADEREDARRVLSTLAEQGALVSARNILSRLQPGSPPLPAPPAATVYCLTTCDRPHLVARILDSMHANWRHPEDAAVYIIDDSRLTENQKKNEAVVQERARASGLGFRYFGPRAQQKLLKQLGEHLPQHRRELDFLFGRFPESGLPSYGRSRNWSLLLGAGKRLIQFDDDILFQACRHPGSSGNLYFTSSPRQADFFDSREEMESLQQEGSENPASGAFLSLLGASLSQVISHFGKDALSPNSLEKLLPAETRFIAPDSQLLITSCGYLGDPGTKSSDWLFLLDAESRQRLTRSEAAYEHHRTARNVWLGSSGYNLVSRFALMSGLTGLANTELLPPYFPLFRNEDYLFGNLVKLLHPHSLLMDMPWAVPHLPADTRTWNRENESLPIRHGLLDFLSDHLLLAMQNLSLAEAEARLASAAQRTMELAEIPEKTLEDVLRRSILALRTQHIRHLAEHLEEAQDAPDYWKRDLEKLIQVNEQGLMKNRSSLPIELEGRPSPLKFAQGLFKQYGQALAAWAAIRNAAISLQEER